jgi:hypothetical protein
LHTTATASQSINYLLLLLLWLEVVIIMLQHRQVMGDSPAAVLQ